MPVESTIMVAIPELDGAAGPMVYGGRSDGAGEPCSGCEQRCVFERAAIGGNMHVCVERAQMLASRTLRLVALRRAARAERKVAIVLFNFPPNAGNTGTAAFLSVFESLQRTLQAMAREGYQVEVPASVDELRERIVSGNAGRFGADANVHARIAAGDHVTREKYLRDIEAQWGPAFEKGFAPTHAFSAFYRWLREDFGAHAVLHFGTHGALEFMPGKQAGMSGACWPDRMIGDLPNFYLYAANNPSEGTIAKRRSAATLVSYLTPPVAHAGLYKGLLELKASIERWRALPPREQDDSERINLASLIQAQASALELADAAPAWGSKAAKVIATLSDSVLELEYTLIPHGLHVVGEAPSVEQRIEMLQAVADASHGVRPARELF